MTLTTLGLIFDIIGFLLVFIYGGFNLGESVMAYQDSKDHPYLKIFGGFLVILGFSLQICGSLK